ncbi:MAG: hypothetical protein II999_00465 [Bacteroidaceae bacterium]|nr:hypothetical protein [Bacteroidaceae bacterium]
MKKLVIFLLTGFLCANLMAQSDSDTKALINKIKRSQSYLSAEATMATEEEAMNTAKELLVSEINEWVATKSKKETVKQVVLQDINSCTQLMDMKRGVRTRAFVYVKKKDIVLIYGEGQIVLNEEELQPLASIASSSSDVQEKVEQPSMGEKQSEAVVKSENVSENAIYGQQITPVVQSAKSPIDMVLEAPTMTEMKPVFANLKGAGKISYGVYSANVNKQNCYLLFYDRQGVIKGVIKKSGESYTDVRTGSAVSLASYSGLGTYWFVLE